MLSTIKEGEGGNNDDFNLNKGIFASENTKHSGGLDTKMWHDTRRMYSQLLTTCIMLLPVYLYSITMKYHTNSIIHCMKYVYVC